MLSVNSSFSCTYQSHQFPTHIATISRKDLNKKRATKLIESHREAAEIYHGENLCKQKLQELLAELAFPNGLFPADMVELGYNRAAGFVWFKHKMAEHKFKKINKVVAYDIKVAAFALKGHLQNIIGMKSKEIIGLFPISQILIDNPSSGMITFKLRNGMSGVFPLAVFELSMAVHRKD